jgi:exonuclease VII large subunit
MRPDFGSSASSYEWRADCRSRMQFEMPASRPLCAPCQAVMDHDAAAVMVRRDLRGNSILCSSCRQQIFSENSKVEKSQKSFVFENPAKPLTQALTPTLTQSQTLTQALTPTLTQSQTQTAQDTIWNCKRCSARVWAKPRAFLGDTEPETWWWCRVCIRDSQCHKSEPAEKETSSCGKNVPFAQCQSNKRTNKKTNKKTNKGTNKRKTNEVQSNTLDSWCTKQVNF